MPNSIIQKEDRKAVREFRDFPEFYKFYVAEHCNPICRRLHFAGSSLFFLALFYSAFSRTWIFIPVAMVLGYALAWSGHFFFEKNRPATFGHFRWSGKAGRIMYFHILCRKIDLSTQLRR